LHLRRSHDINREERRSDGYGVFFFLVTEEMPERNRDIDILFTMGRPDRSVPGAHEHEMRPFHGAVETVRADSPDPENRDFVDELVDDFRLTPLAS